MTLLTSHAESRMRQRAISYETVEYLMECGRKMYDHHGAVVRFFDKKTRQQLLNRVGSVEYKKVESELDAYVVTTLSGKVVTVGHRDQRMNRH